MFYSLNVTLSMNLARAYGVISLNVYYVPPEPEWSFNWIEMDFQLKKFSSSRIKCREKYSR